MSKATRTDVDAATIEGFAREWADWRLGGCPGYGFHAAFKKRVEKVARKAGQSFSELWVPIHVEAERRIEAGLGHRAG
jgi:hypothetical protein